MSVCCLVTTVTAPVVQTYVLLGHVANLVVLFLSCMAAVMNTCCAGARTAHCVSIQAHAYG